MKNLLYTLLCLCMAMFGYAAPDAMKSDGKPFAFTENKDQIADQHGKSRTDIDFKLSLPGVNVFIGDAQFHYQFYKQTNIVNGNNIKPASFGWDEQDKPREYKTETYRLDITLIGANKNAPIITTEATGYTEHYYLPQCQDKTAQSYNKITYKDIYPKIDWVIYTNNNELKYDFVVHEGGDAASIKLKYAGATSLTLRDGAITAATPFGNITDGAPYVYDATTKRSIQSSYKLEGNVLSYNIAKHSSAFVIDPYINWATYYGGTAFDVLQGCDADVAGNAFICGHTLSTANIATSGSAQQVIAGSEDAFIAKFNKAGQMQWATYYGGNLSDMGTDVACDGAGNVYLAGHTWSNGLATPSAHQIVSGSPGYYDAILVKFDKNGNRVWATYYGGEEDERRAAVSCDASGNVFLSGYTDSQIGISSGATVYRPAPVINPNGIGYLAKFNSAGVRQWGTYFGAHRDDCFASTCDASGNVYVVGQTSSITSLVGGAVIHQPVYGGGQYDGFIAKFSGTGAMLWVTYYGGSGNDYIFDVKCDRYSNVYIAGYTESTTGIATSGTLMNPSGGFLVKLNSTGVRQWGKYFCGNVGDLLTGVAVSDDYIYTTGSTSSTTGVASPNAYQPVLNGGSDGMLTQWDMNGNITWGTYFGGNAGDNGGLNGCAWSPVGQVFVAGTTTSNSSLATAGAFQTVYRGNTDGFLTSFTPDTIVYIRQPYKDTVFCPGNTFKLAYGVTYNFLAGNVFTAELSDASGNFSTPIVIGTKQISVADTIVCVIPGDIPPGLGYRIRIKATGPVRISADNGDNIRIKPMPANVNAGGNTPLCEGAILNLTGSATAAGPISYSWKGPNSFSSNIQNLAINPVASVHAGDYILKATVDGCGAYDTVTINVKQRPIAPITASNSPVCPGANLNLTANSNTPGVTYQWSGPMSFTSNQQNPSIGGAAVAYAGMYNVVATIDGCTSTGSTTVQVTITTPTPIAGSNSPVCTGEISLTATTIPGATYQWTGPNGFTSSLQNPVISNVAPTSGSVYSVRATLNGCTSLEGSATVIVHPTPYLGAYASPNDTVCAGTVVTFVTVPMNGVLSPQFQWFKNNTEIQGATSITYIGPYATGDSFYCRTYASNICSGSITLYSNKIGMVVKELVSTLSASISSSPGQALPGQPVTFNAVVASGGYNPKFQWKKNGVDVFGAITANWNTNNLSPYDEITCFVTTSDTCAFPKTTTSNKIIVGFATGIDSKNLPQDFINVYPNPVRDKLVIEIGGRIKNGHISITDIAGRVMYETEVKSNKTEADISALPPGIYMLRYADDGTVRHTVKLVKD